MSRAHTVSLLVGIQAITLGVLTWASLSDPLRLPPRPGVVVWNNKLAGYFIFFGLPSALISAAIGMTLVFPRPWFRVRNFFVWLVAGASLWAVMMYGFSVFDYYITGWSFYPPEIPTMALTVLALVNAIVLITLVRVERRPTPQSQFAWSSLTLAANLLVLGPPLSAFFFRNAYGYQAAAYALLPLLMLATGDLFVYLAARRRAEPAEAAPSDA